MAEKFSHANCDHPSSSAARAICRRNRAKLEDVKDTIKQKAPMLQVALTAAHRDTLLLVAGTTMNTLRFKLGSLTEADLADIDLWFEREMPGLVKVVKDHHKKAGVLTMSYLRKHAALSGFTIEGGTPAEVIEEQLIKSLTVTGPGAFKKHIAGGGTEEEALKVMQTTLPGAGERLALQGSHKTLTDAVEDLDSPLLGYTRRTSASPCAYCAGLSHDPVYVGEKDVKTFHAHDHCTCTGEPFYTDAGRKKVNRLTEAEQFREQFDKLDKKSILQLWDIPSVMVKGGDEMDFELYAYEGHAINRYLRNGAYDDDGKWIGDQQMMTLMDSLVDEMEDTLDDLIYRLYHRIDEAPELQNDMIAFRGIVDGDQVFGVDRWKGNLEGLTWFDEGFTSTTVSAEYADVWAGGALAVNEPTLLQHIMSRAQNKSVLMNLLIRKGTKLVSLDTEVAGGEQFEVLLQRGEATQFKIIKDYKVDPKTGVRTIDVEVTFGGKKK